MRAAVTLPAIRKRGRFIGVGIVTVAMLAFLAFVIISAREEFLRQAAGSGSTRFVEALLDLGTNPDARDGWGGGALYYAAAHGHTDVVSLLLERGVDVNQTYRLGRTALRSASENGHLDTVMLLAAHDAAIRAEDRRIAIDSAGKNGHHHVVEYLNQTR